MVVARPHSGLHRGLVNDPRVNHPQDPMKGDTVGTRAGPPDILADFMGKEFKFKTLMQ